MPSLNLTDAWKDYTPPSPPDTAGQTAADTPPAAPAPGARTSFFLSPETTGLLAPGNIDLRSRPVIHNPDGTVSTPRTLSIARDGRQYLIPTVSDEGELLSDQDAITRFEQTGRHLGAFKTLQDATGYANQLHRQQEILYAASPEDFQGWEIQNRPPVSDFPGQAATPLSPARPRTLFDQPLTTPLIPSSTRPAPAFQPDPQRLEQLHALILHSKQDPELDALLETNPAFRAQADLDDGSLPSRALLGQQILREIAGDKYAGEPGFYFLALKEKLPEAATRQEAYAAVYDHYAKAIEKQYQENKTRKAAYQKNRTEVEGAVAKVIGSLWTPADLNTRLTPEQTDVYRKEFDTAAVEKAHAAFSILKQAFSATPEEGLRRMVSERTAMQITSALSDNDGTGKLTISETAFGLFEGALHTLMEETKEQSGDEYKFLHNLRLALFSPVIKRDATLGTLLQINSQQNNLIPFAHEHNDKVLEKTEETLRDYQTYLKNDKENARVLGLLSTGQDLGNSPNERAPFAARTVNCLGSVCGQTAPFFIPYAGWGLALAGAYDDKRNRAYYAGLASGTAEWSAFIDAAASTAVEKISYGALGRLSGAGWLMSKLPFMGKTRKALTDSLWKHVLFETGAGIVEETFIEPTAEAVIQWAVRGGIAPLAGIDAGADYDWNNYWQELKGMLEPDQLLATALFVGGLAGTQSAIMQRSLITHSRSPEMLMSQGIPEAEAKRITQIPDNGERIAAVRNAVARLKTRPPAEVLKKAKKGVKAFQSLAEIRATVESEAYQYFQSAMHLPLVEEKLDKPGTYAVTIFDPHSGQKKFTQEMTGAQLTAHFGQYLKSEQRAIIAQAQSDFAANAFMRTSEAHGAIQTQDMLQWSRQDQENAPKEPESATKKPEDKKDSPAPTQASDNPPAPQTAPAQTPPASDTAQETSSPSTATDTPASTATDSPPATAHTDSPAPSENLSALGRFIRTFGSMGQTGFSYLTRVALEEWNRRLASGLSREQAAAAPFAPLSPYAPLGTMLRLEEAFKKRLKIAEKTTGEEGSDQTRLFQMRTAPGTTPADILFLVSKGLVGTSEMLEDLFEVGIKNLVKGEPARLEAMGALLRDTQAGLQKLGFQGQFISSTGPLDEMKVVEAMSKLALSDTLVNAESLPLPQWQKDLLQYHVNYLQDAAWLLDLGHAWNLGREKGTITRDMADILRDLGHIVHTMYDQAKIEQQDIQAVMEARALTGSLDASGIPAASEIRERQQKDAEEEKTRTTTGDRSKERSLPQTALQRPETLTLPEAPATMKGVFVNGASYNPDAGTWLGMVPVDKLHLSPQVPQVKVNSGKKGVVNPLVGDYRADAPPIYVWKRTTGRLEVVSGRHRLDLAQRTGIKAIPAYVYEEDATHNARWARLLDYEQNMQDDQADELTAAIYVRETSLTDDELTRRGLTRSGTRSRRGLLIGREAREDLWTRFRSGAITAQNAEAICLLTRHIRDKARIDAMQTTAANDLANGKTLEFIAAKIQLMAHASADGGMVQGLITFGDTFESDMEKAAEYVSRSITTINDHINAIKGVRTISKKDSVLATEGITAGLSADPAERLRELELLKAMYEKIGLYENLRIRALAWDGKTPPDPIGDHRLDMQAERARAAEDAIAPGSPDAAFSLTSLHQIVSTLTAPSLQATRAAALVKDFDKAAENWKRVMSGKQDRPSARIGAELFGTINALLSSARYVLPPGYRSQVDMQMQWASIYAAMAESGEIPPKGTLRTGEVFYENFERSMINQTTTAATEQEVRETLAAIGGQRLDHVMSKILDRVRGQLIYFAKDELFRKTMKRVEAVYPKKEPGRKSPRGRMEAQAYRTLARCRQMLAANAREKAEAMTALEALYNKEEDEDKQQEYEQDLLAWKTYGDYKGMSLPQAQEAMKKLLEFLLAGRNSWDHKLKKERGGAKFQARQIQKNLPEANSTSTRAGAKIEHHTKLRKLLASLPYSFMSYAQLMLALEPILGQRFSRARIREITEANAALLNASNDRSAWLFKTIARITGVKSESAAEQWMVRFNKPENTKIPLVPVLTVKITLPIEEAQAWLTLTREERDARRQEIRAEDQRTETLTENVPEEEDILHLRMALDEYERRSPARRQYQQNITSQREVPNKAGSGPLICSRDCALYALLLHEQPDYADVYDDEGVLIRKGFLRREGLDDAGIAALYDYVGPDGLEYGYALRKRLNETGQTLAQIYEQRMGVPFTLKEKYFRATFDRNSTREKDTLTEPQTGSIGGGKYGLLIDRVVHSENLDLSKSGTLVFLAAAAEQDNYIYTSHITTAWRALLKDKTLEQKLKQRLGEDMLGKLASWMDLIDGASLENNRAFLNLSRMQGMLQRAFAFSVLAGNGYVLLKQSTAILHGFFAGWVPSAVLERADGARELAHRHISASSYLFHLAASKLGLGDISLAEVAATPYFTARMRGAGAMLAQIGNQMPGQRYSRLEKLPEKAMDLIETVDVKANLLSMHALANAYYAHARALNKANDTPFTDTELREAALRQVGMTLELGAQPLTKTQKSMNQAAGGILSKLAFVMKSEQLNKIGLMAAEWKTGSARNRVCAAQSWLALGVTSSLLAWLIAWIKGMDDEDDKEKKWKKYAATALLGDLTTIPLAGEGVNYLASLITGERVFADSYARSLIDVQGVARTVKKEYEHVSDKKEMDWDTHFNNLTSLARAAGVGGAFSRSPSAILSSYGALSLSAATGANISRTAKDLLTTLFRNEDEDRKKKKKKRKRSPKKQ